MDKRLFWINVLVLFFFVLDRYLKKIALGGTIKKSFFINFSLSTNPNIALNIPLKGIFFYFLLIIILFWIISRLIKSYQQKSPVNVFSFSLILVGAFSNVLDRWKYGSVIDYFDLPLFTVFNIADLMILAGAVILIWRAIVLGHFFFVKKC